MTRATANKHQSFYYTNQTVRKKIDKLLLENARIWANLGTNTKYDLKTRQKGELKWKQLAKEIKKLDEVFFDAICPYGLK